ncbi:unnamed protein product [Rotaria socialis]|uniref:F-box domain-containing protein n=1 Tax=Rotaria socialis TaxID=392032 RepID=A0A820QPB3_9BILA|nr:unnamed protein product [Rotaria socialis]
MTTVNDSGDVQVKDKNTAPLEANSNSRGDNMSQLPTTSTNDETATTKSQEPTLEQAFFFGLSIDDAVNSADNLMELFYNACKFNHLEIVRRCVEEKNINVNELFNNDYPLCIASHKGHIEIVRYLLAHGADVHLKRELNLSNTRGTNRLTRGTVTYGDSTLSLAVKYGFEDLAMVLVEHGADILNSNGDFEKSALQDAIRLNRSRILNVFMDKLKNTKATSDYDETLLLQKKGDILRQCLINDQIEALRIFVPNVWEELNSDFMFTVLSNLMLKNKIQSDKAFDVLEAILDAIPTPKLKMYDIGDLLRRFLHILQAQFVTINDDRIQMLYLRTSLLFTILKYHETVDFTNYLDLLDAYFRGIYHSVESTGEGINQIYEYIVRFYENLILMGHLILTNNTVILKLLECEHVQQMQPIDMYLSWRARNPFQLKETCRLMIKMATGNIREAFRSFLSWASQSADKNSTDDSSKICWIFNLPPEILQTITDHLTVHDIISLSQTCQTFYTLIKDDNFWVHRIRSQFSPSTANLYILDLFEKPETILTNDETRPSGFENIRVDGELDLAAINSVTHYNDEAIEKRHAKMYISTEDFLTHVEYLNYRKPKNTLKIPLMKLVYFYLIDRKRTAAVNMSVIHRNDVYLIEDRDKDSLTGRIIQLQSVCWLEITGRFDHDIMPGKNFNVYAQ